MYIKYSAHFIRVSKKRFKRKPQLRTKVKKQLDKLLIDPNYPSLKIHKLKGERKDQFSIWIEGNLRVTFYIKSDYYLLIDLVNHDEYQH